MNKDFRVNVRVTNANIQRSIEGMGYSSMPKWCQDFGYPYGTLNSYINMTVSPLDKDGNIKMTAGRLCDLLGESFDNIFSEHQRDALATNKASIDVSFDQIQPMLTSDGTELLEHVFDKEKTQAIYKALASLTPSQRDVLVTRFGLGAVEEQSLAKIAELRGVSVERIRQIESHSLRLMRRPCQADELREFFEESVNG